MTTPKASSRCITNECHVLIVKHKKRERISTMQTITVKSIERKLMAAQLNPGFQPDPPEEG